MTPHKVGLIGGDGIGPEVVAEAMKVVSAVGVRLDTVGYDLGAARYLRTGEALPDSVLLIQAWPAPLRTGWTGS